MAEEVTEVTENPITQVKLYTIADAAKRLDINYNRLMYAIAKKWVNLYQEDPVLIEEDELMNFAKERNITVPNENSILSI